MNRKDINTPPLVSVVIPCYNSTELRRTLESVRRQSYPAWEVLCVDDGSELDLQPVVASLDDSRIQYHRLARHTNANVARNYGIRQSRGAYIAMLDSDDEWLPDHLKHSLEALLMAEADGIYGSLILRRETDKVVTTRARKEGETTIDFLLSNGYGAQTSTFFMTEASARAILWDETLKRHQDYDFVVRYCRKYKMCPKLEATTIYHCSASLPSIDFDSCIRFIRTVKDEITDHIYMNYHRNMLQLALRKAASGNIIQHYRQEATRYAYLLSFYEYLVLRSPQGRLAAWKLKMKYIREILSVHIADN